MNWLHAAAAAFAGLLGLFIALNHPLSALWSSVAFLGWSVAVGLRPTIWPLLLPALLPVAGLSAWTGWIAVEEFDLLLLGAVLGSHAHALLGRSSAARPARQGAPSGHAKWFRLASLGLILLALSWLLALLRGLADALATGGADWPAGIPPLTWFDAYQEPLNSLRVGKSYLLMLLLLPSLRGMLRLAPAMLTRRLAVGVATGLALASLAIVRERAGYPGLFDFSTAYRSTALFWEMHVGGAALDGFLAMAVPFAVYAVLQAPGPWRWTLAAVLAVIATYACLTSFSRGVYLAVGVGLLILSRLLRATTAPSPSGVGCRAPERWRLWGGRVLVVVLAFEVVAVLALGDFMGERLSASKRDLGGRLQHWSEGLDLLRGPAEVAFGRGLGRFPANYSRAVPERAIPGGLRIVDEPAPRAGRYLRAYGPAQAVQLPGAFDLLQRVPPLVEANYTLAIDLRATQAVRLRAELCQRQLLYAEPCGRQAVLAHPGGGQWQHFSLQLTAGEASAGWWQSPGPGFLALQLLGPAASIDLDNLSVRAPDGRELLRNGAFADGMRHWFFAGHDYFVPWHVDNLFLEMLIDQGLVGLLLLLALLLLALANLLRGPGRTQVLAPYLFAALLGSLVVGVFSSLLDMPRTAFLFFLLLCSALFLDGTSCEDAPERLPAAHKGADGHHG
ncbi:MAG: O-antigen ligase family protein [Candidatus Accumulibacter sp.]|uniref:O-antigen ligase family protein n=1 Tax=Accumulibacter sp. TaxID=2053492 RepID=UPI0025F0E81E|nr:O-antigen ligase family protein [Accumulibacter sp.]MCP5249849.1 O-antigen ligase family protein [Accumulibacter sp.]